MTHPSEEHRPDAVENPSTLEKGHGVTVEPDMALRSKMQQLLGTPRKPDVSNILSPDGKEFDMNTLLRLTFPAKPTNLLFADALAEAIQKRWEKGNFVLNNTSAVDMSSFEGLPVEPYEFMPTQVAPDSIWFGIGKLHIKFPAGCKEAKEPHLHPGGRIVVVVKGKGTFSAYGENVEEGEKIIEQLEEGSVVIMPKLVAHNFAALDGEDMYVVSIHIGYAGTKDEAFIALEKNK